MKTPDRQKITSRKNELIKFAAAIGASAEKRAETKLFLIEGARLCEDAAKSGIEIVQTFFTLNSKKRYAKYLETIIQNSLEVYEFEEHVAKVLSNTKNSQDVFCVCKIKDDSNSLQKELSEKSLGKLNGRLVALENLQDPSNLGTVLRTAEALGIETVILAGKCCDIYSPKVLRASMGAVFRVSHYMFETAGEAVNELKKGGYVSYAAVAVPTDADIENVQKLGELNFSEKSVIFIGNEGSGLSEEAVGSCDYSITIPMRGRAESLNAAAAASILLWEMSK